MYDYIRTADEKNIYALYNLPEDEIEESVEWWKDKQFMEKLEYRYAALESGTDKGVTIARLQASAGKLHREKYGR